MAASLVSQKILANGNTVYGQLVTVTEDTYAPPLPGLGETAFSVSVSGARDLAPFAAGFRNVSDVRKFLHAFGDNPFTVFTHDGDSRQEVRTCLGIPKGMMGDLGDDAPEFTVQESEDGEAVPTVNDPARNQTAIVVTNEQAKQSGKDAVKVAKDSDTKRTDVPTDTTKANARS